MEKTKENVESSSRRAKEVFRVKAGVLIENSYLLGLSQSRFNRDPSQERQDRGIVSGLKILFGLLL